ncbi:Linear primary-alkylsulfatase [Brevibacillus sp. IT-7CA2]|uniref:alkyl/aryl-sulfatase n=1 Tax=Brevibacillus sp. IT-7CA2 TaxID=3026436 RepID=UPI0039E16D8C
MTLNQSTQSGVATTYTKKVHEEVYKFDDNQDFEDAHRGFIAPLETKVMGENGRVAWDLEKIAFLDQDPAPETVNPSLWRNGKLQAITGLFKVVDGIYQVRGQGLATTIIIEGKTGIIVCDTQTSVESAQAAMEIYYKHRPKKPVTAVIISQSHVDHHGGIQGVLPYSENSEINIIAPKNFTKEAISEQMLLGTIMSRRSQYQSGSMLPIDPKGQVNVGIGHGLGSGRISFELPTMEIENDIHTMEIDGITFTFLLTLNTEAPSEMHFYIHDYKVIYASENANKSMHQIYTVRGAKTRDALAWANALDQTIDLFMDKEIEALMMAHAWPVMGKESALAHLKMQRDLYKYMHDQTVRLANHGYTMEEIAEEMKLPETLDKYWGNRGYYGTLKHNVKGIYNFYLGYYSGHPSDLDPLPQVEAAKKYVQYMGGPANVMNQAKVDFERGEYRWVAQVLKHVVMAAPDHGEAKALLENTYEQLGYQAESVIWRNIYLAGAHELRNGVKQGGFHTATTALHLPVDEILKLLAVRVNGPKAEGKKITMNVNVSDTGQSYAIYLENSVFIHKANHSDDHPDASLTVEKATINKLGLGLLTLDQAIADGSLELFGDRSKLNELFALLDSFQLSSNIVTP